MPRSFDLSTPPAPTSDIVDVVANPATTMAVIEYKGGWGRKLYQKHEDKLLSALATALIAPAVKYYGRGITRQ